MQFPTFEEATDLLEGRVLLAGAVFLSTVGLLLIVARILRNRGHRRLAPQIDLSIDLESLEEVEPPVHPRLDCYHLPARIALVVVAPLGRGTPEVSLDDFPDIVEQLRSGLSRLLVPHRALLRRWPAQLSSRGFEHAFFAQVRMPGNRGRGTRWCSLVGRLDTAGGDKLMVGLALCADHPNSLGQIVIRKEHEWFDILRIREPA